MLFELQRGWINYISRNVLFKYLISSLYHAFKMTMLIENSADDDFTLFEA